MTSNNGIEYQCDDFMAFQETLKAMRKIDDNIVYALNTTIPTASFVGDKSKPADQCKELWGQLLASHTGREKAIKKCIFVAADRVKGLKYKRETDENNVDLLKQLRKEQTRHRLMQNELNVEEVVKDRSLKVFTERCRQFYKSPIDVQL